MSNQVVDEINSDTNLSWNEINGMVDGLEKIEQAAIPEFTDDELNAFNDPIMRIICKELNFCLSKKPLPHESLLPESEATKLSKVEKRMAEAEYNRAVLDINERRRAIFDRQNFNLNQSNSLNQSNNLNQSNSFNQQNNNNNLPQSSNTNSYNNTWYQPVQNQAVQNQPIPNQSFNFQFSNGSFNNQTVNYNDPQTFVPQTNLYSNFFQSTSSMPSNILPNIVPNFNAPSINFNSSLNQSTIENSHHALVPSFMANSSSYPNSSATTQDASSSNTSFSYNNAFNNGNTYNPFSSSNEEQFARRERANPIQRNFVIPQDFTLKDETGTEISLKKGQLVLLIHSENSLILRTFSGKKIHIKGAFANFFSANNQPNLVCIR